MSTILLIETADEVCSVGIARKNQLLHKEEVIEKNAHSRLINPLIEKLLKQTELSFSDLDAIAVSKGPGSYTGLRIGTATAKAFCYALEIPLISINSLFSLSKVFLVNNKVTTESLLMPMFDARRMEVYTALFNSKVKEVKPTTALVLDSNTFKEWVHDSKVLLFGNGSIKCKDLVADFNNVQILSDIIPSVEGMVMAAYKKYQDKDFEDVAYFEPFYLKDFVTTAPKRNLV